MMKIGASFTNKRLFEPWFSGPSWANWRIAMMAAFGEPLNRTERAIFKSVAAREPPRKRVKEFWAAVGRRGGKDSVASGALAHISSSFDPAGRLRPGERALVACLAVDRAQAQTVLGYTRSYFERVPALAAMVERETDDGFELANCVDVRIMTADYRSVRGATILACVLDEVAHWKGEHTVSPDKEVWRALRPGMATLSESMLIGISTVYGRAGLFYERWARHYGRDSDDVLFIQAPSKTFNPLLAQSEIDAALVEDPEAAKADYLSEWRDAVAAYIGRELIEDAIDRGVTHRPYDRRHIYTSWIDASSGQQDSFTAAVAHAEGQVVVLDTLLEVPAPFDTEAAVAQVSALLRSYHLRSTMGDDHARGWVVAALGRHHIQFEPKPSGMDRSALYSETLPKFSSHQARLLDHKKTVSQYCELERRILPTGREQIDHPNRSGHHDDCANAIAGALWRAARAAPLRWTMATVEQLRSAPRYQPQHAARILGLGERALAQQLAAPTRRWT